MLPPQPSTEKVFIFTIFTLVDANRDANEFPADIAARTDSYFNHRRIVAVRQRATYAASCAARDLSASADGQWPERRRLARHAVRYRADVSGAPGQAI
jgi:hypothetical protein